MFEEYRRHPYMTRQRMFFEAMEEILPGVKIIIDNGDGSTSRMLPLDNFLRQ
jgi:membrane protease subunit HflK